MPPDIQTPPEKHLVTNHPSNPGLDALNEPCTPPATPTAPQATGARRGPLTAAQEVEM